MAETTMQPAEMTLMRAAADVSVVDLQSDAYKFTKDTSGVWMSARATANRAMAGISALGDRLSLRGPEDLLDTQEKFDFWLGEIPLKFDPDNPMSLETARLEAQAMVQDSMISRLQRDGHVGTAGIVAGSFIGTLVDPLVWASAGAGNFLGNVAMGAKVLSKAGPIKRAAVVAAPETLLETAADAYVSELSGQREYTLTEAMVSIGLGQFANTVGAFIALRKSAGLEPDDIVGAAHKQAFDAGVDVPIQDVEDALDYLLGSGKAQDVDLKARPDTPNTRKLNNSAAKLVSAAEEVSERASKNGVKIDFRSPVDALFYLAGKGDRDALDTIVNAIRQSDIPGVDAAPVGVLETAVRKSADKVFDQVDSELSYLSHGGDLRSRIDTATDAPKVLRRYEVNAAGLSDDPAVQHISKVSFDSNFVKGLIAIGDNTLSPVDRKAIKSWLRRSSGLTDAEVEQLSSNAVGTVVAQQTVAAQARSTKSVRVTTSNVLKSAPVEGVGSAVRAQHYNPPLEILAREVYNESLDIRPVPERVQSPEVVEVYEKSKVPDEPMVESIGAGAAGHRNAASLVADNQDIIAKSKVNDPPEISEALAEYNKTMDNAKNKIMGCANV